MVGRSSKEAILGAFSHETLQTLTRNDVGWIRSVEACDIRDSRTVLRDNGSRISSSIGVGRAGGLSYCGAVMHRSIVVLYCGALNPLHCIGQQAFKY